VPRRKRFLPALVVIVLVVSAVVVASWAVTDTAIALTSGEDFCASCHTMEPMAKAYREDVHGGASAIGVRAQCVDCHLPHEGSFHYLLVKARIGFHDVWAQLTYDLDAIDWQTKREHRADFVYDSGCLHCHAALARASEASPKTFVAHLPYFQHTAGDLKCVSCHAHAGHRDLGKYLPTRK
jgi:cytochrome c-type protein NapC